MDQLADLVDPSAALRTGPLRVRKVSAETWDTVAQAFGRGEAELIAHWAAGQTVYLALGLDAPARVGVLALETAGTFPSIGRHHAPARRPERAIRDLHGLVPEGAPDSRPWLIHQTPYPFLPVEGESLHQIPVGPVHAGIIEPGHFRFTAQGETVVRLEARLGYTHKGVGALMRGATPARGAEIAGRVSGDSAVAYGWAYAQAVEAALGLEVPPRALHLRALMAEMERLANHLGDIGAICNDAAFAILHAHTSALRERVLRAADAAFGHRLMRGVVVPGGCARDLDAAGAAAIAAAVSEVRARFPALVKVYDTTPSLLDRTVGTGRLSPELAARFAAGGFVGRASGRGFDARRDLPYAPYDTLVFDVPTRTDGDVNARVWVRIEEVTEALSLILQLLEALPGGPVFTTLPAPREAEGLGLVEGFRGDVFVWVSLDATGRLVAAHLRDPSWFQWPLLEAAIEGNIVADFPLCNKSFNCSYSGHDL